MEDSAMMEFMRCAMDTNNPEQVLQAAKTIVNARERSWSSWNNNQKNVADRPKADLDF